MSVDVYASVEREIGDRKIISPLSGNFENLLNLSVFNAATILKLLGYDIDINDLSMTIEDVEGLIARLECAISTIKSMPGIVTRSPEIYQYNEGPVMIHLCLDDEGAYRRLSAMLNIAKEAKAHNASVTIA